MSASMPRSLGDRRQQRLRRRSALGRRRLGSRARSARVAPDRLAVARASRARRSSAAGFRPDTTCPGRNAGSRPARSARAAGGSARRPGRAWSGRRRRCSTPPPRNRRSRRRSARRPWSAARPALRDRASTSLAERVERCPAVVRERLGDARVLGDARRPACRSRSRHWRRLADARDRRGVAVMRRRGERHVALAGRAGPRSGRGRSSRRRAGRPRTRRAGR